MSYLNKVDSIPMPKFPQYRAVEVLKGLDNQFEVSQYRSQRRWLVVKGWIAWYKFINATHKIP
jgi:hypothetical protein